LRDEQELEMRSIPIQIEIAKEDLADQMREMDLNLNDLSQADTSDSMDEDSSCDELTCSRTTVAISQECSPEEFEVRVMDLMVGAAWGNGERTRQWTKCMFLIAAFLRSAGRRNNISDAARLEWDKVLQNPETQEEDMIKYLDLGIDQNLVQVRESSQERLKDVLAKESRRRVPRDRVRVVFVVDEMVRTYSCEEDITRWNSNVIKGWYEPSCRELYAALLQRANEHLDERTKLMDLIGDAIQTGSCCGVLRMDNLASVVLLENLRLRKDAQGQDSAGFRSIVTSRSRDECVSFAERTHRKGAFKTPSDILKGLRVLATCKEEDHVLSIRGRTDLSGASLLRQVRRDGKRAQVYCAVAVLPSLL